MSSGQPLNPLPRDREPTLTIAQVADYLRANLAASGGRPVVEDGARVEGTLVRSVVWAGEAVGPDEVLEEAIRAAGTTLHPLATTSPRGQ